ncbi:MAG: hypothetical protein AB1505_15505 [Candidatus Latescibacterota bacterium]
MGEGSVREGGNDVHEYTFCCGPYYDYGAAQIDGGVSMPGPAPGADVLQPEPLGPAKATDRPAWIAGSPARGCAAPRCS